MKINWNKYSIFKDQTWPWDIYFHTDNLLSTLLGYLKLSGCWPIDYGHYLPKSAHYLVKPLHWMYAICVILVAIHLAILFLSTLVIKVMTSDYDALMELGDFVVGFLLYGFIVLVVIWCNVKIHLFTKIIKLINEEFKMRSAIGN